MSEPRLLSSSSKAVEHSLENTVKNSVMVTGVECAGLVLAVLPLFVEAGKAYSDGVETILNVSLRSRRVAELSDFYDEFYWAIGELSQYIKTISDSISDPTATTKPPSASQLGDWSKNAVVETKLRKYLRSETAFNKFTLTTKRIVQLLAQMLKEQGKYVSRTHQVSIVRTMNAAQLS